MKKIKQVSAAIIIEDDKILITRRSINQSNAGCWEFPGGKIEPNETIQECLRRELQEELCVDSEVFDILTESTYKYEFGEIHLIAIEAKLLNKDIKLTVHDKFLWIPVTDLLTYNLSPADIPIAEEIIARFQ
jgi:8-oxo-dGTP diphosphatase